MMQLRSPSFSEIGFTCTLDEIINGFGVEVPLRCAVLLDHALMDPTTEAMDGFCWFLGDVRVAFIHCSHALAQNIYLFYGYYQCINVISASFVTLKAGFMLWVDRLLEKLK